MWRWRTTEGGRSERSTKASLRCSGKARSRTGTPSSRATCSASESPESTCSTVVSSMKWVLETTPVNERWVALAMAAVCSSTEARSSMNGRCRLSTSKRSWSSAGNTSFREPRARAPEGSPPTSSTTRVSSRESAPRSSAGTMGRSATERVPRGATISTPACASRFAASRERKYGFRTSRSARTRRDTPVAAEPSASAMASSVLPLPYGPTRAVTRRKASGCLGQDEAMGPSFGSKRLSAVSRTGERSGACPGGPVRVAFPPNHGEAPFCRDRAFAATQEPGGGEM